MGRSGALYSPAMSKAVWQQDDLAQDPHRRGDKPQKVQAMFSAIAGAYDLNNRLHSFGLDQRWRRAAVRMARVAAGDDVVDVAAMVGRFRATSTATPRRCTFPMPAPMWSRSRSACETSATPRAHSRSSAASSDREDGWWSSSSTSHATGSSAG